MGGHDLDELDLSDMRRQIGIVPQEPIIVPGTIADNIAYGISEASSGDVEYASLMAGAREFILSLPNGYETYVGENGMLLSGGQRQRIAIARALIRHPCLLILDEPTNHLDAASYHVLMNNLRELEKRTTMLVITHNPDVVEMFEVVYVLREGALTIMHRKGLRIETSVPLSSRLNVFANSAPTSKR